MTTDLAALAERVEQAEGPSRALDYDITFFVTGAHMETGKAPAYTASLDAAMTLVPEGWFWEAGNQTCSILGDAMLHKPEWINEQTKLKFARGRGKTPALALVAAALRAKGS